MKNRLGINKTAILNILSAIVLQGIAFITTPIFTRMLGTAEYGKYSVYNSWMVVLSCFMGCGITNSLATGKYKFESDYLRFRTTLLVFGTLTSILFIGGLAIFIQPLSSLMNYNALVFLSLLLSSLFHYIVGYAQNIFIYEKRAVVNFVISIALSISTVVLSIIFILNEVFKERYLSRILGGFIPYLIAAIFCWILLYKECPCKPQREYIKFGLYIGVPIIFHTLAQNILGQSDRLMMDYMDIPSSNIGIYSLFYTLCNVLVVILNALNSTWTPFYYDDLKNKNTILIDKKSKNYIELFSVLVSGFLLLSREVTYIMADYSYWSGIDLIPILAIASYFTFMYQFHVNYEFYLGKTKAVAIGTVSSSLINIILNALLIPLWGMFGAAIATSVSYFCLFVFHSLIVKNYRYEVEPIRVSKFGPGAFIIGISIVLFFLLDELPIIRWIIGICIGMIEIIRIYKRKGIF